MSKGCRMAAPEVHYLIRKQYSALSVSREPGWVACFLIIKLLHLTTRAPGTG
jgi:hypothetical protein